MTIFFTMSLLIPPHHKKNVSFNWNWHKLMGNFNTGYDLKLDRMSLLLPSSTSSTKPLTFLPHHPPPPPPLATSVLRHHHLHPPPSPSTSAFPHHRLPLARTVGHKHNVNFSRIIVGLAASRSRWRHINQIFDTRIKTTVSNVKTYEGIIDCYN